MIKSSYQAEASHGSAEVAKVLAASRRIQIDHVQSQMSLNIMGARPSRFTGSVTGILTASPFLLLAGTGLASPYFLHFTATLLAYPLSALWALL